MRTQYATQFLLPSIAKRIDEIEAENYSIPVSLNHRQFLGNATSSLGDDGLYSFAESDYVDPEMAVTYDASGFVLCDEISAADIVKLGRINSLFEKLLGGSSVSNQQLQSVIGGEWLHTYQNRLNEIRHNEELIYADGMPVELKRYNEILNQADFTFGRAERMAAKLERGWKYKRETISRAYTKAESLYERALEDLEETFGCADDADALHKLNAWMDRDIDFSTNGLLSMDQDGIPRVRGSKSGYAQDAGLPKLSKRLKREESMLMTLLEIACEIAFVLPQKKADDLLSDTDNVKLRGMFIKLKNSSS